MSTVRSQSGSIAPPLGRTYLQALWGGSAGPEDLATNQTVAASCWQGSLGLAEEDLKERVMERIEAIIRPEQLNQVKDALAEAGLVGLKVTPVTGRGIRRGIQVGGPRGVGSCTVDMLTKVKLEIVVREDQTQQAIDIICEHAGYMYSECQRLGPCWDHVGTMLGQYLLRMLNKSWYFIRRK